MALHKISVGTVKNRKLRITQTRFCYSRESHNALGDVVILEFLVLSKN